MNSRIIRIICVLFATLCLIGCGNKKAVNETELQSVIEKEVDIESLDLSTSDFSVIKRQTNEKTDYIWAHWEGGNNHYFLEKNFKITYVLYNDGWRIEEIIPYSGEEYYDRATPTQGVSREVRDNYVTTFNLIDGEGYFDLSEVLPHKEGIQDYILVESDRRADSDGYTADGYTEETYYYDFTVIYPYFDIKLILPICFQFVQTENNKWEWIPHIDQSLVEKEFCFNEGILGDWETNTSSGHRASVFVYDYNDNQCYSHFWYVDGYSSEDYQFTGWLDMTIDGGNLTGMSWINWKINDIGPFTVNFFVDSECEKMEIVSSSLERDILTRKASLKEIRENIIDYAKDKGTPSFSIDNQFIGVWHGISTTIYPDAEITSRGNYYCFNNDGTWGRIMLSNPELRDNSDNIYTIEGMNAIHLYTPLSGRETREIRHTIVWHDKNHFEIVRTDITDDTGYVQTEDNLNIIMERVEY